MEYKNIKGIDIPASRIVMGTHFSYMVNGDYENSFKVLDYAFENGINFFDTAHAYGRAEEVLGEWIRTRDIRKKVIILTKGCNPEDNNMHRCNPKELENDLLESLKRLKTDYIDIYLLHRDDLTVETGPIVKAFNEWVEKGKIKVFGGSNWTVSRIEESIKYSKDNGLKTFGASSPCYSLVEQIGDPWGGSVNISGDNHKEDRAWYIKNGMPVISYSALARGFLSGKVKYSEDIKKAELQKGTVEEYYFPENMEKLKRCEELSYKKNTSVASIALAYVLRAKMNIFPIISPSKIEHIKENLKAFEIGLDEEETKYLDNSKII